MTPSRSTLLAALTVTMFCVAFFQNCKGKFASYKVNASSTTVSQSTSSPTLTTGADPTASTSLPVSGAVSVPLYQTSQLNPAGATIIRQSIFVQIGNSAPIEAMFDTGSTGLRVLSGVLNAADYQDTGVATTYAYGAGQLSGTIGNAVVTIGSLKTKKAIPIQVVAPNGVGCPADKPNCSFKNGGTIFGLGSTGKGFRAIIGVSMKGDTVPNPLAFLGPTSWIIDLGLPSTPSLPGSLILNPSTEQTSGFALFPLSKQPQATNGAAPLWADNQIPLCVINDADQTSTCAGASLDTGAFNVRTIPAAPTDVAWAPGSHATLQFTDGAGAKINLSFVVGASLGSQVLLAPAGSTFRNINTGPLVFFSDLVLYQFDKGVMGLKPR